MQSLHALTNNVSFSNWCKHFQFQKRHIFLHFCLYSSFVENSKLWSKFFKKAGMKENLKFFNSKSRQSAEGKFWLVVEYNIWCPQILCSESKFADIAKFGWIPPNPLVMPTLLHPDIQRQNLIPFVLNIYSTILIFLRIDFEVEKIPNFLSCQFARSYRLSHCVFRAFSSVHNVFMYS